MPVTAIFRVAPASFAGVRAELLAAAMQGNLPADVMLETSLQYLEETR